MVRCRMVRLEELKEDEKVVLSRLLNHVGEENAVTTKVIGFQGAYLREIVHTLRGHGVPICSGNVGYWLAGNESELRHTIDHLKSRARSITEAADSLSRSKVDSSWYELLHRELNSYGTTKQRKLF